MPTKIKAKPASLKKVVLKKVEPEPEPVAPLSPLLPVVDVKEPVEVLVVQDPRALLPRDQLLNDRVILGVMTTLLNGRNSRRSENPFLRHDEYMQQLLNAYTARDQERFLEALRTYLTQSALLRPQGGYMNRVGGLIDELRVLMGYPQVGFPAVAAKLLSIINAPW